MQTKHITGLAEAGISPKSITVKGRKSVVGGYPALAITIETYQSYGSSPVKHLHFSHDQLQALIDLAQSEGFTPTPPLCARRDPHGAQEYKGNGKHHWENVSVGTRRLRVPGGWLYSSITGSTFVPMPGCVGYSI